MRAGPEVPQIPLFNLYKGSFFETRRISLRDTARLVMGCAVSRNAPAATFSTTSRHPCSPCGHFEVFLGGVFLGGAEKRLVGRGVGGLYYGAKGVAMQDLLRKMVFGFVFLGAVVVGAVALVQSVPRMRAYRQCDAERVRLQGEVDAVRQQVTETRRKIDRFNRSPYYVEYLARENHRVAENEVVLIFED